MLVCVCCPSEYTCLFPRTSVVLKASWPCLLSLQQCATQTTTTTTHHRQQPQQQQCSLQKQERERKRGNISAWMTCSFFSSGWTNPCRSSLRADEWQRGDEGDGGGHKGGWGERNTETNKTNTPTGGRKGWGRGRIMMETGVLRQRELEGVVNQHRRHIRCNWPQTSRGQRASGALCVSCLNGLNWKFV